jgi:hypothetical protein
MIRPRIKGSGFWVVMLLAIGWIAYLCITLSGPAAPPPGAAPPGAAHSAG